MKDGRLMNAPFIYMDQATDMSEDKAAGKTVLFNKCKHVYDGHGLPYKISSGQFNFLII